MAIYWTDDPGMGIHEGFVLEARAQIALKLIDHFGAIAGVPIGEDSTGRSVLALQAPADLVARAFGIADAFVLEAERREAIRVPVPLVEAMRAGGQLERIKEGARYSKTASSAVGE